MQGDQFKLGFTLTKEHLDWHSLAKQAQPIFGVIGLVKVEQQVFRSYLEHKKASVEVAWVDENSAELPTLE
jgi:hypothetical protein